jgi:hypothetical protein
VSGTPGELGLHPGSRAPTAPEEVEALLRQVPGMAFVPEVERCLPDTGALAERPSVEDLTRLADPDYLARVLEALAALQRRADAEENGGLGFLAHTLRHFLSVQRLPPGEHPLVVGLYLRAHARRDGRPDDVRSIALAMDHWAPG